jgi:hypothetical protein
VVVVAVVVVAVVFVLLCCCAVTLPCDGPKPISWVDRLIGLGATARSRMRSLTPGPPTPPLGASRTYRALRPAASTAGPEDTFQ